MCTGTHTYKKSAKDAYVATKISPHQSLSITEELTNMIKKKKRERTLISWPSEGPGSSKTKESSCSLSSFLKASISPDCFNGGNPFICVDSSHRHCVLFFGAPRIAF